MDLWGKNRKLNTVSLSQQPPSACLCLYVPLCNCLSSLSTLLSVNWYIFASLCLCLFVSVSVSPYLSVSHSPSRNPSLPPLQFLTVSHNGKTLRLKLPSFILKTRLRDISKHRSQKPYMELYFTFRGEQVGPLSETYTSVLSPLPFLTFCIIINNLSLFNP